MCIYLVCDLWRFKHYRFLKISKINNFNLSEQTNSENN